MENKKLTAVEWLIERLRLDFKPDEFTKYVIPQAIEMERQQIITARVTAPILPVPDKESYIEEAEQYYSETYKKTETI